MVIKTLKQKKIKFSDNDKLLAEMKLNFILTIIKKEQFYR